MNIAGVLKELEQQRLSAQLLLKQLDQAIQVLSSVSGNTTTNNRPKRRMSTAARRRIAAAQKARWAKWKKQKKAGKA